MKDENIFYTLIMRGAGGKVKMARDMSCEILENLLELPEERGYHLELNLVKWGDNGPKYDLRRWNDDRSRMTKGITLSKEELLLLRDEISKIKL